MLPASVVVDSTQDLCHRASRRVQHAQQEDQPSKKSSLLTILGLSSILLRRRRQARRFKSTAQFYPQNRALLVPPLSLRRSWRCQARRCPLLCVVVDTSASSRFRSRRRHIRASCRVRRRSRHHVSCSTRSAVEPVVADSPGLSSAMLRRHARLRTRRGNSAIEISLF
jgi:hypothetical protein